LGRKLFHTGVLSAYRGRKIALALKVLAARYARQHGAREIGTDNDSLNPPILAINQKMGYQPHSGRYMVVRHPGVM
jgi:GNAT superfamily N-acetyltransferase